MNCSKFENLLGSYTTDKDFPEDLAKEFEDHYMSCDACWKLYQDQLKVLDAIGSATVEEVRGNPEEPDKLREAAELFLAELVSITEYIREEKIRITRTDAPSEDLIKIDLFHEIEHHLKGIYFNVSRALEKYNKEILRYVAGKPEAIKPPGNLAALCRIDDYRLNEKLGEMHEDILKLAA